MKQYIAIFIGGALGALLRFEMSAHIRKYFQAVSVSGGNQEPIQAGIFNIDIMYG